MKTVQVASKSGVDAPPVRVGRGEAKRHRFVEAGTVLLLGVMLSGCARSPASRHYVFAPQEGWRQVAVRDSASSDYTIRFAVVKLPAYLDRPQIVTRASDNEIHINQFDRWGMPLGQTVTDVLGGTITKQLTNAYMDVIAATSSRTPGYLVQADIVRLDGPLGGPLELIAQWQVTRGGEEPVVLAQRLSRYERESADRSMEAYVEAIRSLVAQMGEEIAGVIGKDQE
jgi:uncharacterized lipoprotein YmbA